MADWKVMVPPNYAFDESDIEALKEHTEYLRNLACISKQPHELTEADLVNWSTVEWNRYTHVRAGSRSPYATIWDYVEPPIGTYRWERGYGDMDCGLGRLQSVPLDELIPYGGSRFQWDLRERAKVASYVHIYKDGPTVSAGNQHPTKSRYVDPIKVYIDGNGRKIIMDGYKRWQAAKDAGLTEIRAWVFEAENDALITRTIYCKKAIDEGKHGEIPQGEYALDKLGPSSPAQAKTIPYSELRKVSYPSIGDQLDAILKYILHNEDAGLEAIKEKVLEVKARFPKDGA